MTADREVAIAYRAARLWAARYGGRRIDPRELVGAAWQGLAARRCKTVRAAWSGIIDHLRVTGPLTRAGRDRVGWAFSQMDPDTAREVAEVKLAAPADEPARPTPLAVWCETAGVRAGWPLRARVFLYLRAVEGLSLAEIGRAVGCSESWVCESLRRGVPGYRELRGRNGGGG